MPRTPRSGEPTPIDQIRHGDTRSNIPTAEGAEPYYDAAADERAPLRYPRAAELDPQLVWRGKDAQDGDDLVVDAPAIYIQEKIDPRVLVENVRAQARTASTGSEVTLWDDFDGLEGLDSIDYYRHEANWSNRMILGDSLQVMGSLAEREALVGKVQMIYIDPPYGIRFNSNWQVRTSKRDVKDGKIEDSAREAEQIKAFRDTWSDGIHTYLSYLRDRLVVARELLTESGSVFVQIGDENVHLVRSLLDEVFGAENFVSLISYATTGGFSQSTALGRAGDYIVWYAKSIDALKTRRLYRHAPDRQGYNWVRHADGTFRGLTADERARGGADLPSGARLYKPDNIQSQGAASSPQPFAFGGRTYSPGQSSHWKASFPEGMNRLAWAGRIHTAKNSIQYVRYVDDFPLQAMTNVWNDTATGNFTDDKLYVVQTGSKAIERCMLMCTDPGDIVLDPTCGSGTTAYVAEQWGRRWITIDTSRVALALARQRLMGARYPYYELADADGDVHKGFVYDRVPHVTLKSIANNPDIREGMTVAEVDAAVTRHAESEVLYDKPKVDSKTVRVSGRFTFESLSPHRSLSFETQTPEAVDEDAESVTFEQSILDNLQKSGIQNGSKSGRFSFATLEPFAGQRVQAVGERQSDDDAPDAASTRVAIAIGPQYGTVSAALVKETLREAATIDPGVDVLYVLGFAFDPNVEGARQLGRIRVEAVRMNVDLLMLGALKKTGAGNLFTVFGEPDIDVRTREDGRVEVQLRGVDVFNPNTGEVRSSAPDQIALWMIDTRYDEESFFVRHAYFTGENDPYKNLKAALRAEIDESAWEMLRRHVSMPFDQPETGKIAVKVINDYGDEVMKVFEV